MTFVLLSLEIRAGCANFAERGSVTRSRLMCNPAFRKKLTRSLPSACRGSQSRATMRVVKRFIGFYSFLHFQGLDCCEFASGGPELIMPALQRRTGLCGDATRAPLRAGCTAGRVSRSAGCPAGQSLPVSETKAINPCHIPAAELTEAKRPPTGSRPKMPAAQTTIRLHPAGWMTL